MRATLSALGLSILLLFTLTGTAQASTDILWVYNSGDRDAAGRFRADGEIVYAIEFRGTGYIDWQTRATGTSRWWIPGNADGQLKSLNLDFPENRSFGIKVCQYWAALPDDCSGWYWGST